MNEKSKGQPPNPPASAGAQIRSIVNGCAVTINFVPKAASVIPEVKRMMLSGVAKT